ncbi:MAG: staygreen family protein [Promethearchaeota archaeon]
MDLKKIFKKIPEIKDSEIIVHFQSSRMKYDKIENFGRISNIPCYES